MEVADLISVLAITMSEKGSNESLTFVLQGTKRNITDWGSEYLRSLSGEISVEYSERLKNEKPTEDLNFLIDIVAPFLVSHKEETEAIDLLMEVEQLDKIVMLCTEDNYSRM
jgi:26S proteasome regulatory subunit N1